MGAGLQYQTIIKYKINATCKEPLHIGNAVGSKEEVLVHPVDDIPFIQAASIAGVFRRYCENIHPGQTEALFGSRRTDQGTESEEYGSRIRFEDGRFSQKGGNCQLELRARVSIDPVSGTCSKSVVKGTAKESGHKFEMEYIGAGANVSFAVYLYDEQFQSVVEEIFAAINSSEIIFGGQRSNGCGELHIDSLKKKIFHMGNKADRLLWAGEEMMPESEYEDITESLDKITTSGNAYEISVTGQTEGSLLVKSVAVTDCGKGAPDSMNVQNAAKDYIVPGSSLKGAIRSQMEKIASYIENEEVIENTFGKAADNGEAKCGNIRFYDTIVGKKKENDLVEPSYRIHIDKFTGGVMQTGLFSEKNVFGDMELRIHISDSNQPERTLAVLLMALRDLAAGLVNIGSGYSVGKGILVVDQITIKDCRKKVEAKLDMKNNRIKDEKKIIAQCMKTIQVKGVQQNGISV